LDFGLKRQKKLKKASRGHNKGNKFCNFDETKHNLEKFAFHHSKVLGFLHFTIHGN
jgi:hypothetical protein